MLKLYFAGVILGIQSTVHISRSDAIRRITEIQNLALQKDYLGIEDITYEPDNDIKKFVMNFESADVTKWTNSMLEELMDTPFFRFSMFDNYSIV